MPKKPNTLLDQLHALVNGPPTNECLLFPGGINTDGYARICVQGVLIYAHRLAWSLHNNQEIPAGLMVLHGKDRACVSRACCNPRHLRLGTAQDNMDDRERDGTVPRGDAHGSRLHPETRARGDSHGTRLHPETVARGDRHGSRSHPERCPRGDANGSRLHPERLPRGEAYFALHPPEGRLRGEEHPGATLTDSQVHEIRKRLSRGDTGRSLALTFGVGESTISRIKHGHAWTHI